MQCKMHCKVQCNLLELMLYKISKFFRVCFMFRLAVIVFIDIHVTRNSKRVPSTHTCSQLYGYVLYVSDQCFCAQPVNLTARIGCFGQTPGEAYSRGNLKLKIKADKESV